VDFFDLPIFLCGLQNLTLRRAFGLFANVRPCLSIPGLETRYSDVDLITVRENTEGEYSGIEHEVTPGVCELMKVVTRTASERVARYAFELAAAQGRTKVSAIHKATIQKLGDGMFLDCCREVAREYPTIKYEESSLDKTCMELVMDPSKYDVMVMPNLYGDIVSDLCAGLVGGLGVTPSSNIGTEYFIAEAVHGAWRFFFFFFCWVIFLFFCNKQSARTAP
jgi:isocitrate dehydrogenase (NAD+)